MYLYGHTYMLLCFRCEVTIVKHGYTYTPNIDTERKLHVTRLYGQCELSMLSLSLLRTVYNKGVTVLYKFIFRNLVIR